MQCAGFGIAVSLRVNSLTHHVTAYSMSELGHVVDGRPHGLIASSSKDRDRPVQFQKIAKADACPFASIEFNSRSLSARAGRFGRCFGMKPPPHRQLSEESAGQAGRRWRVRRRADPAPRYTHPTTHARNCRRHSTAGGAPRYRRVMAPPHL